MAVGHAYAMQGKHSHLGEAVAHILSLIQHEPPPGDGRQGAVCDEIALGMPQGMSRTAGAPELDVPAQLPAKRLSFTRKLRSHYILVHASTGQAIPMLIA